MNKFKWNYLPPGNFEFASQEDWNQTLVTMFNSMTTETKGDVKLVVPIIYEDIINSLFFYNKESNKISNKYIIEYISGNYQYIKVGDEMLKIENYHYNYQKDRKWIQIQKDVQEHINNDKYTEFINHKPKIDPESTNGELNNDEIIYTGILHNFYKEENTVIHFNLKDLQYGNYEYYVNNKYNESILPHLTFKTAWVIKKPILDWFLNPSEILDAIDKIVFRIKKESNDDTPIYLDVSKSLLDRNNFILKNIPENKKFIIMNSEKKPYPEENNIIYIYHEKLKNASIKDAYNNYRLSGKIVLT